MTVMLFSCLQQAVQRWQREQLKNILQVPLMLWWCVQARSYHSINYENSLVRASNFWVDIVMEVLLKILVLLERLQ